MRRAIFYLGLVRNKAHSPKNLTRKTKMWSRKSVVTLLSIAAVFTNVPVQAAQTQSWNYQSYNKDGPSTPGYITLEENDGEATLRFFAGRLDKCYGRELKALVERTETTITITLPPLLLGCDEIRFRINADGTGGVRETHKGDMWAKDRNDRGLTIRE